MSRLQEMGFKEKAARQALAAANDSLESALEQLQVGGGLQAVEERLDTNLRCAHAQFCAHLRHQSTGFMCI